MASSLEYRTTDHFHIQICLDTRHRLVIGSVGDNLSGELVVQGSICPVGGHEGLEVGHRRDLTEIVGGADVVLRRDLRCVVARLVEVSQALERHGL